MTAAMIAAWCEAGAGEIAANRSGPAVQSAAEMQWQMADDLPKLHEIAQQLYSRWITGLSA